MYLTKGLFLFFLILTLVLAGSFSAAAAEATVAVTIVPQLEMVEAVAGEKVEVVEMIPQGFSPANYAPSPAEMRAFNEASIYFSMGVPADVQNILPRAEEMSGLKVVKLFEEIESEYPHRYLGEEDEHQDEEVEHQKEENDDHGHRHEGGRDPHIWLSPARASLMVEIMRDELIEILPEYEAEFKENAEQYLEKMDAVDQKNQELLAEYQGQEILVYHPSFGYFTEHYGLEMLAIEAGGKEPGPRQLQEIIEYARQQRIKNVFYQAKIDSSRTRAVAEELGGEIVQLNPLASNYLDNLRVMAEKMAAELAERDD
ncbi:zinc transport system substrate-binding protein [Halanaerobium saccharolyticum]|uniref:Zinc transport system substrate-binding protein n=1 Tax=Halanaerobium saccharolyticum TaxID=43595 RepID=A0A4R7Z963_9FIRM|nr:zinc ABC transporter substrate-binding protein [Halanaerobium saccharolyticum]RAK11829.1 zinc transport system substrate-binding protein [Halanaerobium saccharolyticum]TDW07670.1 zinc transport system substrate-binding protein [Halanaerobium saccharolyticum]TDX64591.1 zinc transport system substrate-binding protein [Halanaerobium saccharolyticum]